MQYHPLQQTIALIAVCDHHDRLLLLKRTEAQHCAGLWSFPGGKVETEETAKQAAQRELLEETGLSGHQWQQLGMHRFHYEDRHLHFILFQCQCTDISTLKTESDYRWIARSQLPTLPMPLANIALIDILLSH